jgi:hypothetical protein
MKKLKFFMLSVLSLVLLVSCNKETNESLTSDEKASLNESFAEQTFDELQDMTDQAYNLNDISFKTSNDDFIRFGDCVTITLDTTVMPRLLKIDFGEENCLCRDGKYRRGKILVTFNGRYRQAGTVITTGFENYYVNDNHVTGWRTVENMGFNDENHIWYQIQVDGQIALTDGTTLSWQSNRSRTWIQGYNTPFWRDDVYLIEGEGNYSSSSGRQVNRLIIEPIRRELNCRYFVSGTVEITPVNGILRVLDYGEGECDNLAQLTIGDRTLTIVLR